MTALRFVGLLASILVFGLTLGHVLQSPGSRALDPTVVLLVATLRSRRLAADRSG
ncbi:MAG: hypothetical protein KDB72_23470 [Mycobacterium sp.]|nr:hypothetical protein [Mycobacterium sp.]